MSQPIVLFDAHVHVYPGVDVAGLLDAAAHHFKDAASRLGAESWQGVLLLTEVAGINWFNSVANTHDGCVFGAWHVCPLTGETISLRASAPGLEMTLIAGRQIVTVERLEVHALGTRANIDDGSDIYATLDAVHDAGALAVLPWGVGKWLGKRGRLVEAILGCPAKFDVYAADNGGRPAFWPERRFALARTRPLLCGSDPLPLPGQEYRTGGFGSWFTGALTQDAPAAALFDRIAKLGADQLHRYGKAETPWRFFRNQVLLRLR